MLQDPNIKHSLLRSIGIAGLMKELCYVKSNALVIGVHQ